MSNVHATLPQNGVVSVAFDDGLQSQYDYALPLLKAKGMHATFYAITDDVGESGYLTVSELQNLQNNGNEVASHSKTHADFVGISDAQIQQECSVSKQVLQSYGLTINNFAYPYGDYNTHTDSIVSQYYRSARSGYDVPYVMPFPTGQFHLLATGGDMNMSLLDLQGRVNAAANNKGWVIICFHSIAPSPSGWDTGTQIFSQFLDYLESKGVAVLTVNQVLDLATPPPPPVQYKLTVVSGHDSPTPSIGDHLYAYSSSVTCSVTSPVVESGVLYTCAGWTGTGSVPSSGTGETATFTITQDSTITWNWQGSVVQRELTVYSAHDSPSPGIGDSFWNDGQSVTCSVSSPVTEGGTVWTCTGWNGTGSVPSTSDGTSVTFNITQDSSITWNWIQVPSSVHLESTQDNNVTSNLGTVTLNVTSYAAVAIWIDPALVSVTKESIGYEFNVTAWTNMSVSSFKWQVTMLFDPTFLRATRAGYTSGSTSQFLAGHSTVPVSPIFTSSSVSTGESLIGSDSRPAGSGSLCWVELELVSLPNNTILSIDNTDTFCLTADLNETAFSMKYDAFVGTSLNGAYALPNDAQTPFGTYSVLYSPGKGYRFVHWETTGGTTVSDVGANPTAVTVSSLGGTLRAIYAYWNPCDINHDLIVDMKDVGIAARAFYAAPGDPRWNPQADITGLAGFPDGRVDMMDMSLIAKHLQEHYS
jgi:peptidoglycan/xylan/chitin deacetylase (PgdA/CDA1 family)